LHGDGFSIGSDDLTPLALGTDRDSAELAEPFYRVASRRDDE
jgi:phosphoenolpyruvate-protein kinase (PTS system EI component)